MLSPLLYTSKAIEMVYTISLTNCGSSGMWPFESIGLLSLTKGGCLEVPVLALIQAKHRQRGWAMCIYSWICNYICVRLYPAD